MSEANGKRGTVSKKEVYKISRGGIKMELGRRCTIGWSARSYREGRRRAAGDCTLVGWYESRELSLEVAVSDSYTGRQMSECRNSPNLCTRAMKQDEGQKEKLR